MGLLAVLLAGLIISISSLLLVNNFFLNKNSSITSVHQAPSGYFKDTQIKSDFQAIQSALNLYKAQKGEYPDSLKIINDENFIHSTFRNPYTGKEYKYELSGDSFTLSTSLSTGDPYKITN